MGGEHFDPALGNKVAPDTIELRLAPSKNRTKQITLFVTALPKVLYAKSIRLLESFLKNKYSGNLTCDNPPFISPTKLNKSHLFM